MKKKIALVCAFVLVIALAVGGTYAYLTDTKTVTNTFTFGKVEITLDEAKVDEYGVADTTATERVDNNEYKLIPGHHYLKDPILHVEAGSEDCWVFVKITNGLKDIEKDDANTIAAQLAANGWTLVQGTQDVYSQAATNVAGDDIDVFGSFDIADDAVFSNTVDYTVTIVGYAVQADGFETAKAAWDAAFGTGA